MQLVPTPWNRPPEAMHSASSSSVQHKSAVQQPPSSEATHGSSAHVTPPDCGSPPVAKQTSTGKFSMHSPAIQQAANPPRLSGRPASSPNGSSLPSLNCASAGEAQTMKSVLNNSRRKKSTASPLGFSSTTRTCHSEDPTPEVISIRHYEHLIFKHEIYFRTLGGFWD